MVSLWKEMTAIFKDLWIDRYPVADIPYWSRELSEKTNAQIMMGLCHLRGTWESQFPPNMIQFRRLCHISLEDLELAWPDESFRRALLGQGNLIEMKVIGVTGRDFPAFEACFKEVRHQYLRSLNGLPHNSNIIRALAPPQTAKVAAEQIAKLKEILG